MGFRSSMGETKVLKSAEIPRQPRQELNAQAIADTIAEVEAAIAKTEVIITEIERVVTMAEEALCRSQHVKPVIKLLSTASLGHQILSRKSLLLTLSISSNAASTVSGADLKGKKMGLPAKNLMVKRLRIKKLNDTLYMLRYVVPNITME